jgi:hypothetical protein
MCRPWKKWIKKKIREKDKKKGVLQFGCGSEMTEKREKENSL